MRYYQEPDKAKKPELQRPNKILLVRTDRLGDVVLSSPAIKAIKKAYPDTHIAMMVRPYTEAVVKQNPYVDEVIVYDKYGKHKSLLASLRFAKELKEKKFDISIIFHPTNRMHIINYLAKIPRRIGYNQNFGFLLTQKVKNTKHEGKKHERDYIFDMLKTLGIEPRDKELYITVTYDAVKSVEKLLESRGIKKKDKIVAIHPGASCASKVWPSERFAKLADNIIQKFGSKVVVVGGDDTRAAFCIDSVKRFMQEEALFLKGELDILQLAALLKRTNLLISNDSGPVHVAVAVNTPVVSIFGRSQPGLSPTRWGPLGEKDIILHKDAGCMHLCQAHNCKKGYECITSIRVDEVLSAIEGMKIL